MSFFVVKWQFCDLNMNFNNVLINILIIMHKKQKQKHLIEYLLCISRAQNQIQKIQDKLISHIRFNPLMLYQKITNHPILKLTEFKQYIHKHLEGIEQEAFKLYTIRHNLQAQISIQHFSELLLPYTPNILRQTGTNIKTQMSTQYLDQQLLDIFHRLLQTQLTNLYEITLIQNMIKMEWDQIEEFMKKEIRSYGKKIDQHFQEETIVVVRKWMELQAKVEEYCVLNLMRWFGGGESQIIRKEFDKMNCCKIIQYCTCKEHEQPLKVLQNRLIKTLKKSKSTHIPMPSNDPQNQLKLFLRYLQIIIGSQKKLSSKRSKLQLYSQQINDCLFQICSKKYPSTKYYNIIGHISKPLHLTSKEVDKLLFTLSSYKIQNQLLFALFHCQKQSKKSKIKQKMHPIQIKQQIYETLYIFCKTKCEIKSIAKQLKICKGQLFKLLDQDNKRELNQNDIQQILNQAKIQYKDKDISLILRHFGNGQIIDSTNFRRIIDLQSN